VRTGCLTCQLMEARINLVKVFSVTNHKDRHAVGEKVTAWIAANPAVRIVKTVVALSSDQKFHCFSIVVFGSAA
jgi:hypothetical protein